MHVDRYIRTYWQNIHTWDMSYVNNVKKLTSIFSFFSPTDYVGSERSLHVQEAKALYSVLAFVM